jgi:hypothetical protein
MDGSQRGGVRVWSVPGGLAVSVVLGVFWYPFYDAIVHGQITPILTGVLSLGMGRKPFVRGLCVGLVAALKPPYALMIPFVAVSFGWRALLGSLLTASLATIPPALFLDYLRLLPELSKRAYGDIGLVRLFGAQTCLIAALPICLLIALRWRGSEKSYLGILATTVFCTALWFHAYTPLVLPAVYFTSAILNKYLPGECGNPNVQSFSKPGEG